MKNIYLQILDHHSGSSQLVLATVIGTNGSTPQKPGSSVLFNKDGIVSGTVGGGIVEGKVQKIAMEAFTTGESGLLQFNLANDISEKEEAICGGQISVLIDAGLSNYTGVFEQMRHSLEDSIPGVLITMVTRLTDKRVKINRYWMNRISEPELPVTFTEKIKPAVSEILATGNTSDFRHIELTIPGEEPSSGFFLEPVFPPPRLVIAGAGHIGRALTHIGVMLGFEVTVVDDRQEYANKENIPEASHIIVRNIGDAMKNLARGDNTYVVIVTRGHKDDAEALRPCIGAGLAYTGMIGSRKKVATMRNHFLEQGWATAGQWDSIYAPIGIDIKSQSVEEIAVSIAAQIVMVKNSRRE